MHIGKTLKQLRSEKQRSATELTQAVGITTKTVTIQEKNEFQVMRAGNLNAVLAELTTNYDQFIALALADYDGSMASKMRARIMENLGRLDEETLSEVLTIVLEAAKKAKPRQRPRPTTPTEPAPGRITNPAPSETVINDTMTSYEGGESFPPP